MTPLPRCTPRSVIRENRRLSATFSADQADQLRSVFSPLSSQSAAVEGIEPAHITLEGREIDLYVRRGLQPVLEAVTGCEFSFKTAQWSICNPYEAGYLGPRLSTAPLELIAEAKQGVVDVPTEKLRDRVIAHIIAAFPSIQIAVVSGSRSDLEYTIRSIRNLLAESHHARLIPIRNGVVERDGHTYFGTIADLQWLYRLSGIPNGLIIFLDASNIAHSWAAEAVDSFAFVRVLGFRLGTVSLSAVEADSIDCVFGLESVSILPGGDSAREINARIVNVRSGRKLSGDLTGQKLRDHGIVYHQSRNRAIVQVAVSSASTSTVIVAADLRHAVRLAKKLPRAEIVRSDASIPHWISEADHHVIRRKVRRTMMDSTLRVVPLGDLGEASLDQAETVIYAAGTCGVDDNVRSITIPGYWIRHRPAIWVDFLDIHHPELRRGAKMREAAYQRWGWLAGNSLEQKVAEYLSRREISR
ncbi:hypothetical protein [Planctomyces sp. SH-PL14]|uniref:hypothetical protein n=1 Tax=Planctomyces sp. SH-PL14 TaxID=1632864 RepID=UPI00078DC0C4|nr:hypothetical protein [Planctomyces sp. SH-PL14]AMV19198.1 hypothetical protein VT03_15010 [Planctomyces sp. SH-PL14]